MKIKNELVSNLIFIKWHNRSFLSSFQVVVPIFWNHDNRADITRLTLNNVVLVGRQTRKFLQKILLYVIYGFYKIYLYRLIVILLSHNVINKQNYIDLIFGIIDFVTIYSILQSLISYSILFLYFSILNSILYIGFWSSFEIFSSFHAPNLSYTWRDFYSMLRCRSVVNWLLEQVKEVISSL